MKHPYLPAIGVGAVAGVRSLAAPALVSRYLKREQDAPGWLGAILGSTVAARLLQAAVAAEMAADKTSWIPDRIAWPSLAWRAVSGGMAGSVLAASSGNSKLIGGALAALAAIGATYGAFYLRQALHQRFHVSQRLLGAAEDSIVMGAGRKLLLA